MPSYLLCFGERPPWWRPHSWPVWTSVRNPDAGGGGGVWERKGESSSVLCNSVLQKGSVHFHKENILFLSHLGSARESIFFGAEKEVLSQASSNARCSTYCLAAGLRTAVLTAGEDKIVDLFGEENAVVVPCIMPPFRIMLGLFSIHSTVLGKQPGMQHQAEWAIQNF